MIEAVNSSVASTQVLRGNAEQLSASRASVDFAAPVSDSVSKAPQAPYLDIIAVDFAYDRAVLQIRDSDTGDVQDQFPTESRLAQLSRVEARQERERAISEASLNSESSSGATSTPISFGSVQTTEIVAIQDTSSSAPVGADVPLPEVAIAALSAGAQSGQPSGSAGVSVFA